MSLPTRADFGGGPDADAAWERFGGKSLDEAYELFCAVPESYQEHFMWMGGAAFRFYFPVVDRYLRSVGPIEPNDWSSRPAWILASCIAIHFSCRHDMRGLHREIIDLCDFVCAHLDRYAREAGEREEIREAWESLKQQAETDAPGTRESRR